MKLRTLVDIYERLDPLLRDRVEVVIQVYDEESDAYIEVELTTAAYHVASMKLGVDVEAQELMIPQITTLP